ncbi:hypothetical protein [Clostridium tertium]|uniref:hypothetical protein n=1 Tax=Clostridium tertium TaxID=1559 RepID=UPI0023B33978|nr:hypothetical protein [Clostridium tertium]
MVCINYLRVTGEKLFVEKFDKTFKAKHISLKEKYTTNMDKEMSRLKKLNYSNENIIKIDSNNFYLETFQENYSLCNFRSMPKKTILGLNDLEACEYIKYWRLEKWENERDIMNVKATVAINDDIAMIGYKFSTSIAPIKKIVSVMSATYPELDFMLVYEIAETRQTGLSKYKDGCLIDGIDNESTIESYRRFCKEYLGYEYAGECPSCHSLLSLWDVDRQFVKQCYKCGISLIYDREYDLIHII